MTDTRRVLIVDDNPLNIELASYVLQEDGFVVEVAIDGDEALQRIPAFQPDLILMDVQLPGVDGLTLTQQLKADAPVAYTVVAFTAYAMRGDEEKMRAAGCDGYIAKPIDVATFAATVRSFMAPLPPRGGP
jgi:two-component system cell cycle response regulator DivK